MEWCYNIASANANSSYILWGDEILADMPSRLGGEDNRINEM